MDWMSSRLEAQKLAADQEKQRQEKETAEQSKLRQLAPAAWRNLTTALEANIGAWNQGKDDGKQLHLKKLASQVTLHNAGQLGSILDVWLDERTGVVRYSAPTRQANQWKQHNGELRIESADLFAGSAGGEMPRPLGPEETSRFLLEPVLFG